MPHLAASVSLAQAASSNAKVVNIAEANKILRFAKETADTPLVIRAHGEGGQIRFGCYTDASWATRPDGSSQGGWLVFIASEDEMNSNRPFQSSTGRVGSCPECAGLRCQRRLKLCRRLWTIWNGSKPCMA